ncbi:peptidase associated/transthyretin-like domain-containing protein [Streptomyces sennicomposti]
MPTPPDAGALSRRVLDPAGRPVPQAEFTVTGTAGRQVVGGWTDRLRVLRHDCARGENRLAVSAGGCAPHRAAAAVAPDTLTALGDMTLR